MNGEFNNLNKQHTEVLDFGNQNVNNNQNTNKSEKVKSKNNDYRDLIIVIFMALSAALTIFIIYEKEFNKVEEPQKVIVEVPVEKNVSEGIVIYGNGKVVDSAIIKKIAGTYALTDGDNEEINGIVISDNFSECKIEDEKEDKLLALRIYLFDYNKDKDYTLNDEFVIEFVRESADESNTYSIVFVGRKNVSGYSFYDLNTQTYYY